MSDFYNEISLAKKNDVASSEESSGKVWLVFKAGEENYAIDSSEVKEILRNTDYFPMPFAPTYIRGVLNSYGTPYAVVDLANFLGSEKNTSRLFLVLKNDNNLSLQISDIQEFHSESEVSFQAFQNSQDAQFFTGTVTFENIVAPALNLSAIIENVRLDIEKI